MSSRHIFEKESRNRKIIFTFLLLFSSTLLSHGKHIGQGDEPHYLMICHSIFFDHDFELQNNYSRDNLIGDGNLKAENHLVKGRQGRYYSIHSIGMPLLWTPLFGPAYMLSEKVSATLLERVRLTRWTFLRLIIALSMLTLACYLAVQIYDCTSQNASSVFALAGTTICFTSIPLLPMGFLFFTEIPAAYLAFLSYKFIQQNNSGRYWLAAMLISYLPFLHIKYLLVSIILFVFLFARWRKSFLIFGASIILLIGMNYYFWETVMPYGAYGQNPLSIKTVGQGLLGLFLDQEFGLLWFSPIYLLVPAGLYFIYKKNRKSAIELIFLMSSTAIVSAAYPMWWGGWSPAARFLTPSVIFMVPLVIYAGAVLWRSRLGQFVCGVFFAFQIFLALIFWYRPKLMWNYGYGESDLYRRLIDGYTLSLPSLITLHREDLISCLLWGSIAIVISVGCMLLVRKNYKQNSNSLAL